MSADEIQLLRRRLYAIGSSVERAIDLLHGDDVPKLAVAGMLRSVLDADVELAKAAIASER